MANRKLSDEDVAVIRDWYATTPMSLADLGRFFKVSASCVSQVIDCKGAYIQMEMSDAERVKELEDGLSKIYEVVAKVSVDTHHSKPIQSWDMPVVVDGSKILMAALKRVIDTDENSVKVLNMCHAAIRDFENI